MTRDEGRGPEGLDVAAIEDDCAFPVTVLCDLGTCDVLLGTACPHMCSNPDCATCPGNELAGMEPAGG